MILTVLILCLLAAGAVGAETVTVPLTDLAGAYDSGLLPPDDAPSLRAAVFAFPPEVVAIRNLQVVMSGTSAEGAEICERDLGGGQVAADTLAVVAQMRLVLTAPTLGAGCFFGVVSLPDPAFVDAAGWVADCGLGDPRDLDQMLGQTVQAELECYYAGLCEPWIDTAAVLGEVRLVLDAQTVPFAGGSWGGVKALYR